MRRLLDQPSQHESLQNEAVRLLRSVDPYHSAPGAKQRVRVAMLGHRTSPPVPPVFWVRAAVLLPLTFASALTFAGTVGRHWLAYELGLVRAPVVIRPERVVAAPPLPPRAEPTPVAERAPVVEASPPLQHPKHLASAPKPARPVATPAAIAEENAKLVVEAMSALRRAHDPARASSLLDEYMRRCPDGPLAEEALALSFEAASSADDAGRERSLATRYLASYPNGRFREAAERVLARLAP